jgi:hypothetical protein
VSAKGESSTGRPRGRRGYTVARPRSNTWLWILNAIVIGFVVVAAAGAATRAGHTMVSATYNFLLYYVGVLALLALTAEVAIGLVATDRVFMKPAGRVTMQAIHRAVGFGAIAFLLVHIVLEILAHRATALDAVIPFLYKHKTFYLGIGTVASDMIIVVMMLGIYRARLATRMSPRAWRVLHATAYLAWVFGIIHGLLGGRPAKSFFGYAGFVYWAYGVCVAAVALALLVRLVAKDRAGNEMAGQPVADSPSGAGWPAAALATGALPGSALPLAALPGGPQATLEGWPSAHRGGLGPRGRPQLALPAGASGPPSGASYLSAPLGQFGGAPSPGSFDQAGFGPAAGYQRAGETGRPGGPGRPRPGGEPDWIAAYERPLGARRPVLPADHPSGSFPRPQFDQPPRYERTGEIDLSGGYGPGPVLPADHPSAPFERPRFDAPADYAPLGPGRTWPPAGYYGVPGYPGPGYYQPDVRPGSPGAHRPPAGAGGTGRHTAPYQPDRAAPYPSFADQDAAYTRPRPPGGPDPYAPQDDTDPMGFAPLDTGNLS